MRVELAMKILPSGESRAGLAQPPGPASQAPARWGPGRAEARPASSERRSGPGLGEAAVAGDRGGGEVLREPARLEEAHRERREAVDEPADRAPGAQVAEQGALDAQRVAAEVGAPSVEESADLLGRERAGPEGVGDALGEEAVGDAGRVADQDDAAAVERLGQAADRDAVPDDFRLGEELEAAAVQEPG